MYFLTYSKLNGDENQRLIQANSWSSCLAYLEGTSEEISQILKVNDNVTVVIGNPNTTNFYNVSLKDSTTQQNSQYILFQNSYADLQTWVSQQVNKQVNSLSNSEKTYVVV